MATGEADQVAVEAGAIELTVLLGEIFHAAKRRRRGDRARLFEASERACLGPRHAPVLFAVALAEEGLSISDLAARVGLNLATTSLLAGELDRAGLLRRREDERDRRRTIVTVHEDRGELVGGWVREVVGPARRALERLDPPAREALLAGMRVLAEEGGGEAPVSPDHP